MITASSGIGGRGCAGCVTKAGVRPTDMAGDDGGKRGCNLASVVYPLAVVWAVCVVIEVCFCDRNGECVRKLHAYFPVCDCYVHGPAGITHTSTVGTVMKRSRGEAYDLI